MKIGITHLPASHKRPPIILPQQLPKLLNNRLRLLPLRFPSLLALQLLQRHAEALTARFIEEVRTFRIQQVTWDLRHDDASHGHQHLGQEFLDLGNLGRVDMERRVGVPLLKGGGDALGVHDVSAIGEADGGDGVGGSDARGRGVRRDAEGGEMGGDLRVFEPVGGVGKFFVVEDEAG